MGLTQTHAISRTQRFFAKLETTAGTWEKPASADAAKVRKVEITPERTRNVRMDSRTTRSALERVGAKGSIAWKVEAEVIPSGTAGTPPDLHALLKAVLGAYANTPGTSDIYSLGNTQALDTLTIVRHLPSVLQESVWGAWVDEMTLSVQGGDTPKLSFSGGAMGYVHTGTSTLNGAMSSSTTMVVETADASAFSINSWISIDDTNDVLVTADASRPSFTVDTSVTESDEAVVAPYAPAETTAGSPLNGLSGSWTVGGSTVKVTGCELNLKNNVRPIDDEALEEFPSDVIPGFREVTGQITMRCRADWLRQWSDRRAYATKAILGTIGSVAGQRLVVSVPYAEFDYAAIDVPEGDADVVLTLPFIGLGSSGEDELVLSFT